MIFNCRTLVKLYHTKTVDANIKIFNFTIYCIFNRLKSIKKVDEIN